MKEAHLAPEDTDVIETAGADHCTRACWCDPIVLELKASPMTRERVIFHAEGEDI